MTSTTADAGTVGDGTVAPSSAEAAAPRSEPVETLWRPKRRSQWPFPVVAVAALVAGIWAIVGSLVVMPELTVNYDEPVYLVQADAIAQGRLFPQAPSPVGSFEPWFAVERDGVFMFKYTPVHAGTLALGVLAFGSARASLGVLAAGAVLLVYALGKEVLRDRGRAAIAALLLVASPLFLIQSMTFLPYISNLVLLLLFATAYLRGARTGRWPLVCASGLALGCSFFARPFDAVLLAAPILAWDLIQHRRAPRVVVTRLAWLALGAAAPLMAMLWFNNRVMGSPFRLVFSLIDPLDKLGFGARRMIRESDPLSYTPSVALQTLVAYLKLFAVWCAGGVVLLGLAAVGLRRTRGPQRAVAAVAVVYPLGYLFFWGPAYTTWMRSSLGPFYYVPVLVPVVILGARGLARLGRWSRPVTACAVAGMMVASGVVVEGAIRQNRAHSARAALARQAVRDADLDDAIVFLPAWHLLIPFAFGRNDADLDGPVIWALERGVDNLAVSDTFPTRALYALEVPEDLGVHGFGDDRRVPGRERLGLQRLERVRAADLFWEVEARSRTNLPVVSLEVAVGSAPPRRFVLGRTSGSGRRYAATLRIGADGVSVVPPGGTAAAAGGVPSAAGLVSLTVSAAAADGSAARVLSRLQFPYRLAGQEIEVLAPADPVPGFSGVRTSS